MKEYTMNEILFSQKSQLLHVLVHSVQWQNMSTNEAYCLGQIEYEAYLQAKKIFICYKLET